MDHISIDATVLGQTDQQNNAIYSVCHTDTNKVYHCVTHRVIEGFFSPLNLEYLVGRRIRVKGTLNGNTLYEAVITQIYHDPAQ
jgi:hypothetical protein